MHADSTNFKRLKKKDQREREREVRGKRAEYDLSVIFVGQVYQQRL